MTDDAASGPETTVYHAVGGARFFEDLVDRFYAGVASDEVLLRLYPEQDDLTGAKERLTLFLIQYWGGPTTYSDARGHPRLRMRHVPFVITEVERDAWLHHMARAVDDATDLEPELADQLLDYFTMAADHLVNSR